MKKFDAVVLDLDGTLWDACEACAHGWTLALASLGVKRLITARDIASVCGLTYPNCVRKLCPDVSEQDLEKVMAVIDRYERAEVERHGGSLYKDVVSGLQILEKKYQLFLVSNCQEWYLDSFFDHSSLKSFFKDWECYGRTQKSKLENLKNLAVRNQLQNPVYVGDTEGDQAAALGAGYEFIFVSYGFGAAKTQHEFSDFQSLVTMLASSEISTRGIYG